MDKIKRKIFRQSIAIALVIGLMIIATIIPPLYLKLSEQKSEEVQHILKNRTIVVEAIFARMCETANQFSSRSVIRDKLVEYNQKKITLEELQDFTTDKLAESMYKSDITLGARRTDINGNPLIEIGQKLPKTGGELQNKPILLEISTNEFVARAPIHTMAGEIVGYDELLFSPEPLRKVINNYSELYKSGEIVLMRLVNGGFEPIYETRTNIPLPAKKLIESGGVVKDDRYVMSAVELSANNFWLLIRIPKDEISAAPKQYIFNILLASLFVVLLAIPLDIWLVSPLVKRLDEEFKKREATEEALKELNSNLERTVEEEISKRRENEYILVHQARVAQMGELITSIAHQWRQPLNALALNIQDIKDAKQHDELSDEYISQVTTDSMRLINSMSKTIDDFRNFYKTDRFKSEIDLVALISDSARLLREQKLGLNVTLNVHYTTEPILFTGYQNELNQFIHILISNAKDAFDENNIELANIDISISKDEGSVVITVEDNAGGIDPTIEDRIFDPYFTTKDQGKGVGLELYVAKIIIEEHMEGKLSYKRTKNGSKFTAILPAS